MPEAHAASIPPASKSTSDGSLLLWLAEHGPKWARVPAMLAFLVVTIVPTLILAGNWLTTYRKSVAELPTARKLQMGVSAKLAVQRANLEDKLKGALTQDDKAEVLREFDEMRHQINHLSNPVDDAVRWTVFEKKSATDYWGYKLLPSDGCLLVSRVENNFSDSQWIKDPQKHEVASGAPNPFSAIPTLLNNLEPSVRAALYQTGRQQIELQTIFDHPSSVQLQPVQACLNPHPGPYQEWWGPYINQCQQPIYRRWNDGCTHLQLYDHCYNVWGPIVWQFCAANHHP